MIAAAEQDYHAAREQLDELVLGVEVLLSGLSEIETVVELWTILRERRDSPAVLLMCAAAVVRLAGTPARPVAAEAGRWDGTLAVQDVGRVAQ
jgi:hypothetical protein